MDIKFCKTNLLIEHKELDGRFQFKFTHPLVGPSKLLLPNPELTTVPGDDLGEPECYYFEEYEAPRMNPSVVAATRGLDFSKSSTNGKGKPWKDAKVHGQDGEQDQEFGEEGFWFFIKKKKATMAPTSLGVDHSSPPKEAPCPRASQSLFFRAKGRRDNTQRRRKSSKARRSSSTTGLDRVQTEETQLDRADGRVDLRSQFENPGFEYDPTLTRTSLRAWNPYGQSSSHAPPRPREPHTLR
ncbi:unnamed protein product [Microthlaspi erraticum]|uniref:Arabidopsis retrotransposon Orf1 C-terminal domain-containing protein n=1 Tax=Microthlaspi erraticum TaxID=1685480 RepID=A0A6D2JXM3_9BRAS|nr:unnamed protein product [Microthlaspi erraticum]